MPSLFPLMTQKQEEIYSDLQKALSIFFKSFKMYLDPPLIAAPLLWYLYVDRQQQVLMKTEKEYVDLTNAILEELNING
jgi:hypothetical protein